MENKIVEILRLLKTELLDNGYLYGFYLNNRRVVPNMSLGFDEEFSRLITTEYRIQSPEITKREKVATCLDAYLELTPQSGNDGVVDYSCAEMFCKKAVELGNKCELYSVEDKKNTHSWYTAGMFLETREQNKGLDKFYTYIEKLYKFSLSSPRYLRFLIE